MTISLIVDNSTRHEPIAHVAKEYRAKGLYLVWRCGPLFKKAAEERHGNSNVIPIHRGKRGRLTNEYTPGPGGDAA